MAQKNLKCLYTGARNKSYLISLLVAYSCLFASIQRSKRLKMSKSKRIYWFELDGDFFNSKIVKKMRKESNGDTLALIYLKILQSTTKTEGIVSFEGIEPLLEDELALLIDEDAGNIAKLLEILDMYDRVERLGTNKFLLKEAENYIFSESESARRMRKLRAKRKEAVTGVINSDDKVTLKLHRNITGIILSDGNIAKNITDVINSDDEVTPKLQASDGNLKQKNGKK